MKQTYKLFITHLFLFVLLCIPSIVNAFSAPLTSEWSDGRMHPVYSYVRRHDGIDLGVDEGTPVPAITSGVIEYAGWADGYGYFLSIVDGNGVAWNYAHLSEFEVNEGDVVSEGEIVALSGATGVGTGAHLHVERREGGTWAQSSDPLPYYASKWDITNYEGGIITITGGAINGAIHKVKEKLSIDFDYTTYFSPSEILMSTFKDVLTNLTGAFARIQNGLLELLIVLIIIDLGWYMSKGLAEGYFDLTSLFPRILRYGFFIFLFKSWDTLIKELFIPMFEQIGSTFGGHTFEMNSFLKFDDLFTAIATVVQNHMKPTVTVFNVIDDGFLASFLPFFLENLVILFILFCAISLCIWVMIKIVNFYIICIFGILGIPLSFVPLMDTNSRNFFGSILSSIMDLIVTCFLFGLLLAYFNTLQPIPKDDITGLIGFACIFAILTVFIPKQSNSARALFSNILN